MCTTKDFFVMCPHRHWTSITVKKKEIGSPIKNSCNCGNKLNEFDVVITEENFNLKQGSRVNYWDNKAE